MKARILLKWKIPPGEIILFSFVSKRNSSVVVIMQWGDLTHSFTQLSIMQTNHFFAAVRPGFQQVLLSASFPSLETQISLKYMQTQSLVRHHIFIAESQYTGALLRKQNLSCFPVLFGVFFFFYFPGKQIKIRLTQSNPWPPHCKKTGEVNNDGSFH